jgi:hypothetical protein
MKTDTITIQVAADVAQAYRTASDEDRRKMDLLASFQLTEFLRSPGSLEEIMDELSREARQNGLSLATLDAILHE